MFNLIKKRLVLGLILYYRDNLVMVLYHRELYCFFVPFWQFSQQKIKQKIAILIRGEYVIIIVLRILLGFS